MVEQAEILPGHLVTGELYEKVRAELAAHAGDLFPELTWEQFTRPGAAYAIPDNQGQVSKVELVLVSNPLATVKVNGWYLPDRRAGDRPVPHNHRWARMRSTILAGGYAETRYRSTPGGVEAAAQLHTAGGLNVVDHHVFHEVTEILEPAGTWTLMICREGQPGDWGYLDVDTGRYTHNSQVQPDPRFAKAFAALNPHASE